MDGIVKRKRISPKLKKTIIDLGITKGDVAYLVKNLMFGHTKSQLVEVIESEEIPIAVQIFAHALLQDYKKGNMSQAANLLQWAFDSTEPKAADDVSNLSDDDLEDKIKKLLTQDKL